eukprot:1815446-Amphidinium_carterae.1
MQLAVVLMEFDVVIASFMSTIHWISVPFHPLAVCLVLLVGSVRQHSHVEAIGDMKQEVEGLTRRQQVKDYAPSDEALVVSSRRQFRKVPSWGLSSSHLGTETNARSTLNRCRSVMSMRRGVVSSVKATLFDYSGNYHSMSFLCPRASLSRCWIIQEAI